MKNYEREKVGAQRSKEIERHVSSVLGKFNISEPSVPVQKIAELEGIIVRFQPFHGTSEISAVLKRSGDKAVIGVNSSHSITRQRFSIAHELGHYFLHKNETLFVDFAKRFRQPSSVRFRDARSSQATNKEEVDANTFAANLLMPKRMLSRSASTLLAKEPDISPDDAIVRLANIFHVSSRAMEFRLLNLGWLVSLDE